MILPPSLLTNYIASLVLAVSFPLAVYTTIDVYLSSQEYARSLIDIQQKNAQFAAFRLSQFVREIENQLRFATHLGWDYEEEGRQRIDALRVLRQAPAISDLAMLDAQGRERVFVSRMGIDRVGTLSDRSEEPAYRTARRTGAFYGPVYLRRDSEPFLTMAIAGSRPDTGVVVAEINLKYVRDVVTKVQVGRRGQAYVVDGDGRLIAHPDMGAVLRKTDLSSVVGAIRSAPEGQLLRLNGFAGQPAVLAATRVPPLDWLVLVELPEAEANEPQALALSRSAVVAVASLLVALVIASLLAWRMVRPIRILSQGAERIGAGHLDHRIRIDRVDELGQLSDRFNAMASDLERSYATLEGKVAERTRELSAANLAKSKFLAAASHDLRQPLHALNLLVAQLSRSAELNERQRLTGQIERAVDDVNGLFDDLLDISKLEAGIVRPEINSVSLGRIFERVVAAYAPEAARKQLRFRVRATRVWVRSDAILLQRIVSNLVANALRYTVRGGVLLGCRVRGDMAHIEVWDTGIGIPADKQREIFEEFVQIEPSQRARREGLGLGLAIVARLSHLLGHTVDLQSQPGRGSCFRLIMPVAEASLSGDDGGDCDGDLPSPLRGCRILVIDDDPSVLDGTAGLLRQWGCEAVTALSRQDAMTALADVAPDLIITDLHLGNGDDGLATTRAVRANFGACIPAVLVSADIAAASRFERPDTEVIFLVKPVAPLRLKTALTRLLQARNARQMTTPAL